MKTTIATLVIASGLGLSAAGCYATVDDPVGYAEVTDAPVDVDVAPYVIYEGRTTYYTGGRWWYRDGDRWAYYHNEPEQLQRQRAYVQRAPAARRVVRAPARAPEHEREHER
jgi:hypothetical protein